MPLIPALASLLSSNGVGPIGQGYTALIADGWRRFTHIGSHYAARAVTTAMQAVVSPEGGEDLMRRALRGGLNYMTEMASIPALAFDDAVTDCERAAAIPPTSGNNVRIIDDKPIMLPVRFGAASQGWALYLVDAAKAQAALDHYGEAFQVCRLNGKAMLVIYGMDFQQTDLGQYLEMGVQFIARPKGNPSALPGAVVTRMAVDSEWSRNASNAIWSFDKLLAPRLNTDMHRHNVAFTLNDHDDNTLAISLPRFGSSRTTDVPLRYFTTDRVEGPRHGQPLCTVFHRSARGEGTQYGGDVRLRLGDGDGKNCFCAIAPVGQRACTCKALRDMGLPGLQPVANGWAEHLTGHVDPAYAVAPRPGAMVSSEEKPPAPSPAASAATPPPSSPRRRPARRQA